MAQLRVAPVSCLVHVGIVLGRTVGEYVAEDLRQPSSLARRGDSVARVARVA